MHNHVEFDYIKELRRNLTSDDLVEVFATIAELNETPFCENWVKLITAFGVSSMLQFCKQFGGTTFQVPELYQVLVVYAALIVLQLERNGDQFAAAKHEVLGNLYLEGFDDLVEKLRVVTNRSDSSADR